MYNTPMNKENLKIEKVESVTSENEEIIRQFYFKLQEAEYEYRKERDTSYEESVLLVEELKKYFEEDETFEYYLLKYEDEYVGFIEFGIEDMIEDKEKKYLRINALYIDNEYRGNGLATYLMDFSKNRAREIGLKVIGLGVITNNIPAKNLYYKLGFKDYVLEMLMELD